MTTAVRLDDETKSKLKQLQAEIELRIGNRVTQREILSRLIKSAIESRAKFMDSFRSGTVALDDDEIDAFNRGKISSGVETDEEDIDDVLYG